MREGARVEAPPRYYTIQTRTRWEARLLAGARVALPDLAVFWPRRSLRIRRAGAWRETQAPVFPGYVFLRTGAVAPEIYWTVRRLPGFLRFLRTNQDIRPLPEADARILTQLLRYGEIVRKSLAAFDADNRIRVIEGPLKEMEGRIVSVDKRKGRVRVKLDLYDESHLVDFGFTSVAAD